MVEGKKIRKYPIKPMTYKVAVERYATKTERYATKTERYATGAGTLCHWLAPLCKRNAMPLAGAV